MSIVPNALQSLIVYSSESEEEVGSCHVSTKRLHENGEAKQTKRMRLPVPDISVKQLKLDDFSEDDSTEHQGRVRNFPHERGNWVTYIYLPFESNEMMNKLQETIMNLVPEIELNTIEDLHLSLTKTVVLKHHWIDLFMKSVREKVITHTFVPFYVYLGALEMYTNETKTRTFLGLKIRTGCDTLTKAVEIFDECLMEFNLETFYKDPSFHMSILWCNGDKTKEIGDILDSLQSVTWEFMQHNESNWFIAADHFNCKCGNKNFEFFFT